MLHYVSIVCLLGAVAAAPSGLIEQGVAIGSVSNPSYGFNYAVSDPHTGDNKAQSEQRIGGVVKGSYSLSEPDGTIRVVDYNADPVTGFNAVVKRIGAAAHPQQIASAPVIVAPAPVPIISAPVVSKSIFQPIAAPIAVSQSLVGLGDYGLGLKGGLELGGLGLRGGLELGSLGLKGGLGLGGLGLRGGLGLGPLDLKGGLDFSGLGLSGFDINALGALSLDAGLLKH